MPQAVPCSALVIGLTTLVGYFGFVIYLCISDWQRRTTAVRKSSVSSKTSDQTMDRNNPRSRNQATHLMENEVNQQSSSSSE